MTGPGLGFTNGKNHAFPMGWTKPGLTWVKPPETLGRRFTHLTHQTFSL